MLLLKCETEAKGGKKKPQMRYEDDVNCENTNFNWKYHNIQKINPSMYKPLKIVTQETLC